MDGVDDLPGVRQLDPLANAVPEQRRKCRVNRTLGGWNEPSPTNLYIKPLQINL